MRSKHVQNPAEYLRWRILLRTLCNYSKFRGPIDSKLSHIQNYSVSATPLCTSFILVAFDSDSNMTHGDLCSVKYISVVNCLVFLCYTLLREEKKTFMSG